MYGVCLGDEADILAARPGARLWSADPTTGDVIATLNFQATLAANAPATKYSCAPTVAADHLGWDGYPATGDAAAATAPAGGLNLSLLLRVQPALLLSWAETALFLLDLAAVEVNTWYDGLRDVRTVAISDRDVFVLNDGARRLTCLTVRPRNAPPSGCTLGSNANGASYHPNRATAAR